MKRDHTKLNLKQKIKELEIGTLIVRVFITEDKVLGSENALNDSQLKILILSEIRKKVQILRGKIIMLKKIRRGLCPKMGLFT